MVTDYPDDADGKALRRVAASGADMSEPVDIAFFIVASDEAAVKVVAEKATGLGYRTAICFDDDVEGAPWTCECTKSMIPAYQAVTAAQAELDAIARPLGAYEYPPYPLLAAKLWFLRLPILLGVVCLAYVIVIGAFWTLRRARWCLIAIRSRMRRGEGSAGSAGLQG